MIAYGVIGLNILKTWLYVFLDCSIGQDTEGTGLLQVIAVEKYWLKFYNLAY